MSERDPSYRRLEVERQRSARLPPYSEPEWTRPRPPLGPCQHGNCYRPRRSHEGPPYCRTHGG